MLLTRSVLKAITTASRPVWRRLPLQRFRPLSTTHPKHSTATAGSHTSGRNAAPSAGQPIVERRVSLDDFKRLADNDTATVDDAKLCLKQSRAEMEELPVTKRQDACAEQQVGGRVMLWMVTQAMKGNTYLDRELADALCWFVLPEDLTPHLFHWIARDADEPSSTFDKDNPHMTSAWRAQRLLGSLINAQIEWSPKDPDPALQCFETSILRFGDHRLAKTTRGIFMSASMAIGQHLTGPTAPSSDPQLFDFFVDRIARFTVPGQEALRRARLLLYHPTRPQAMPLVACLETPEDPVHIVWDGGGKSSRALSEHQSHATR